MMTMSTARIVSLVIFALGLLCQRTQAVDDIYKNGTFGVGAFDVSMASESNSECKKGSSIIPSAANKYSPRPLYIVVPLQSGEYPVIHFQHGYNARNTFFSQLMHHVASHGFIVIAPQMGEQGPQDATGEIADGAAVLDWYPKNLETAISTAFPNSTFPGLQIIPNFKNVVLAGHSRGGKVAFGLATGVCKSSLTSNFSAIVGFDPLDAHDLKPKILTGKPDSLNLAFPTLILGAAYGSKRAFHFLPPCAPAGVNHDEFYRESGPELALHFVAKCFGHLDYLDDHGTGLDFFCWNGCSREPMRTFAGGISIAFLKAVLFHDNTSLVQAFENPSQAYAAPIDPPQVKPTQVAHLTNTFGEEWEIPYANSCKKCAPVTSS